MRMILFGSLWHLKDRKLYSSLYNSSVIFKKKNLSHILVKKSNFKHLHNKYIITRTYICREVNLTKEQPVFFWKSFLRTICALKRRQNRFIVIILWPSDLQNRKADSMHYVSQARVQTESNWIEKDVDSSVALSICMCVFPGRSLVTGNVEVTSLFPEC